MQQHHILHALQRLVRECLAEHAPLAPVHRLVDGVVRVVHALDGGEGIVKIGLAEPLAIAVDVVQAAVRVDGDEVGCRPDMGAVFLM